MYDNKALTLDELREMNGEAVFAVPLGHIPKRKPHWIIVDLQTPNFLLHYGMTWLAYRRRPDRTNQGAKDAQKNQP